VTEFLDSTGYGTIDGGVLANGWRQLPGTPVYGTPYGTFDNEKGTPAGARRHPRCTGRRDQVTRAPLAVCPVRRRRLQDAELVAIRIRERMPNHAALDDGFQGQHGRAEPRDTGHLGVQVAGAQV
jgi:hypothetical protein